MGPECDRYTRVRSCKRSEVEFDLSAGHPEEESNGVCPPTPPSSDYFDDEDAEMASWFDESRRMKMNSGFLTPKVSSTKIS